MASENNRKVRDREVIARMASLLRSGATMLEATCPRCGVPLFRLKSGEIICPSCGQRFLLVSSDEEELRAREKIVLQELESVLLEKILELKDRLANTGSEEDISRTGNTLLLLLQLLDMSRKKQIEENGSNSGK